MNVKINEHRWNWRYQLRHFQCDKIKMQNAYYVIFINMYWVIPKRDVEFKGNHICTRGGRVGWAYRCIYQTIFMVKHQRTYPAQWWTSRRSWIQTRRSWIQTPETEKCHSYINRYALLFAFWWKLKETNKQGTLLDGVPSMQDIVTSKGMQELGKVC